MGIWHWNSKWISRFSIREARLATKDIQIFEFELISLPGFPLCQQSKSDPRHLGHHLATQGLPKLAWRTLFRVWDCWDFCIWDTNRQTCTHNPPRDDNGMQGNKWMVHFTLKSSLLKVGILSPQMDSVYQESKRMGTEGYSSSSPLSLYYKKQHSQTSWRNKNLWGVFEGALTPVICIHGGMSLQPLTYFRNCHVGKCFFSAENPLVLEKELHLNYCVH